MTEQARSMAASLANLEAQHRERDVVRANLEAHGKAAFLAKENPMADRDEVRAYADKATSVLGLVRNKAIEIDSAWRRQRAALRDDIARLDQVHERDMARLADMERRLEIMRGEA